MTGTTPTTSPVASPASVLPEVPRLPDRLVDQLAFPRRETYKQMVAAFRQAGFEMCSDLCAVDCLSHPGRALPEGTTAERFEVVVNLLSLSSRQRVRIRVQVPESDPTIDSVVDIYPGADSMEREAFDLFGIIFEGHPDIAPHLMRQQQEEPRRAQGLRGRARARAVQGSAGSAVSDHDHTHRPADVHEGETPEEAAARYEAEEEALIAETSEGVQGLQDRTTTSAGELRQEVGAVLRLPEGGYADPSDIDIERRDDETTIINMESPAPFDPRRVAAACSSWTARRSCAPEAHHRLPPHRHGEAG